MSLTFALLSNLFHRKYNDKNFSKCNKKQVSPQNQFPPPPVKPAPLPTREAPILDAETPNLEAVCFILAYFQNKLLSHICYYFALF